MELDFNNLSDSVKTAIFFFIAVIVACSSPFFEKYCSFDIWPGVFRQTIAAGIFVILQSNKSEIEHPELMIGAIIILTVITLYVNIRECGAIAGIGALLSQSIISFCIIVVLAILLVLYAVGRGGRRRNYR